TLASVTSGDHAIGVVEWGDGTLTEISRDGGGGDALFTGGGILGSHTYALPGAYVARVTVKEGTHLKVVAVPIVVSPDPPPDLTYTAVPVTATERTRLVNAVLARVSDPDYATSGVSRNATVDWGDGDAELATVTAIGGGLYEIRGSHTYTEAGAQAVTI